MSYSLMPYSVDLAELRSVIGSGDEKSLEGLRRSGGAHLVDRLDDGLRSIGGSADGATTAWDAMRHLLLGEEYDECAGRVYGYCLKIVFEAHWCADALPDDAWTGMRGDGQFTLVKTGLAKAGIDFDPHGQLVTSGPPVPLPPTDDFPQIGHLDEHEVAEHLAAFDRIDEGTVDPRALPAIRQIHGWLRACAEEGRGLVCFHH